MSEMLAVSLVYGISVRLWCKQWQLMMRCAFGAEADEYKWPVTVHYRWKQKSEL